MADEPQNVLDALPFPYSAQDTSPYVAGKQYGIKIFALDTANQLWIPIRVTEDGTLPVVFSQSSPDVQSGVRSGDTYTAAGQNGVTAQGTPPLFGVSAVLNYFSLLVIATGAVTSWTVELQVSVDVSEPTTAWTTILTHTNIAPGTGQMQFLAPATRITAPATKFRTRCTALVLGGGTDVVVFGYGTP